MSFTALTSLLLVLECQAFAVLLVIRGEDAGEPRAVRWSWTSFFVATAVANAFGAAKHGWFAAGGLPPYPAHPEATGLVLVTAVSSAAAMVSVTLAQLAALSRLRAGYVWLLQTEAWLQLVGGLAWVALRPDDFLPVLVHAALGIGLVILAILLDPVRGPGARRLLGGLLVVAGAGGIFALDVSLPGGLSRSDVAHLVMAGGYALMYLGISRMQRPGGLPQHPRPSP